MMTRRKFIPQSRAPKANSDAVIVIGAGIAGLSAAQRLHAKGVKTIILEGRDRIGGRIESSRKWAGVTVELGASWIHGTQANPLTNIAKQNDITMMPTDYGNSVVYRQSGGPMSREEHECFFVGLHEMAEDAVCQCQDTDASLREVLERRYLSQDLSPEAKRRFEFLFNTEFEHQYAANVEDMHGTQFWEGEELDGGDVLLPDGYERIVQTMTPELDIRLRHVVEKISLLADGVRIVTDHGTLDGRAVIVTLPIGVLQVGGVEFDPGLPEWKEEAIAQIGSGILNKTFLLFPIMFWEPDVELIQRIPERHGQWAEFYNSGFYHDGAPVLDCINAGGFAAEIEGWNDADIVASAMEALRGMYGTSIPDPESWQQTRWISDPFSVGAYSYPSTEMTPTTRRNLAKPIEDKIFFAGEATSTRFPATVTGAYLSGHRAANEVMEAA